MALTLADAVVYITGDTSKLDKDLDKAEKDTTTRFAKMGKALNVAMTGAVVAGAAVAAKAVYEIGKSAIGVAREMDDLERQFERTLGVSADRASELGDVVKDVYVKGLGESLTDVADALTVVNQGLGDLNLSDTELEEITGWALLLSDAFEIDVAESVRTVSILMKSGLAPSAEEAFNIIAAGMQNGLNVSDDFLDTLNEYADDFHRLGFTADETLGIINAGLDAGIFNTDKIGDAINEFGIRIKELDTEQVREIDEGIANILRSFQAGEIGERDVFFRIIERLKEMQDPIAQNQAGVMLFGSMWEDLGSDAILAMGDMDEAMIETAGTMEELEDSTETLGTKWEQLKRRAELALEPVGEALINIANFGIGQLESAIDHLELAWIMLGPQIQPTFDQIGLWLDNLGLLAKTGAAIATTAWDTAKTKIAEAITKAAAQGLFGWMLNWGILVGTVRHFPSVVSGLLNSVTDAAKSLASGFVNGFMDIFQTLIPQVIDGLNDAIPNEISFNLDLPSPAPDIRAHVNIVDNPIPGGTRDAGGLFQAGVPFGVGRQMPFEVFVPNQDGNAITPDQLAEAMSGKGGTQIDQLIIQVQGGANGEETARGIVDGLRAIGVTI